MSIWRGGEVRRRRGLAIRWSSMMEVFCRKRSSLVVADYLYADRLWERRGGGRGGLAWSSRSGWGTSCATRWEMLRWKWQAYLKYRLAGIQFQAQSAPQLPLRGEWKWKVCSKTDYSIVSETQVNNFEVLSAIVFGLGGSARTANRGTTNKGFIRWLYGKYRAG